MHRLCPFQKHSSGILGFVDTGTGEKQASQYNHDLGRRWCEAMIVGPFIGAVRALKSTERVLSQEELVRAVFLGVQNERKIPCMCMKNHLASIEHARCVTSSNISGGSLVRSTVKMARMFCKPDIFGVSESLLVHVCQHFLFCRWTRTHPLISQTFVRKELLRYIMMKRNLRNRSLSLRTSWTSSLSTS